MAKDTPSCDVMIIGRGLHGLITANLLAREGVSVTLCDPVSPTGVEEEITQDAVTGPCAHFPVTLDAATAEILSIQGADDLGRPVILESVSALAGALYDLTRAIPAYDEKGWRDLWSVFETGHVLSKLGDADQSLFADLMTLSAVDFAARYGSDEEEQGQLCALSVMGYDHSPSRTGSAAGLIGAALAPEGTVQVSGGLSALIRQLQESAIDYGVKWYDASRVKELVVTAGRVQHVTMEDDTQHKARLYLSDVNPHHLYDQLYSGTPLPDAFSRRLSAMQGRYRAARVCMTLDQAPVFAHLAGDTHDAHLVNGFFYAPSPDYCVNADKEARGGGGSTLPICHVVVPTLSDPALAPEGQHMISVLAQYYTPDLPVEADNQQSILDACVNALETVCAGFSDSVVGARVFMGPALDKTIGPFNRSEPLSAQPMIQILASLSGHHALGADQPVEGLMLVGYGAEAAGAPHLATAGTRAAKAALRFLGK